MTRLLLQKKNGGGKTKACIRMLPAVLVLWLGAQASMLGLAAETAPDASTLFLAAFTNDLKADFSRGQPDPLTGQGNLVAGESGRKALQAQGAGFSPLAYACDKNIDPRCGTLEFRFKPAFSLDTPEGLTIYRLLSSADQAQKKSFGLGINRNRGKSHVWFLASDAAAGLTNYGVYAEAEVEKDVWHRLTATWSSSCLALYLDGRLLGRRDLRTPLPLGASFTIGGDINPVIADALLADVTISDICRLEPPLSPVRVDTLDAKGVVRLERYEESKDGVSFIIEADTRVRVEVSPIAMAVKVGELYWLATSFYEPRQIRAAKDGCLNFELDAPKNCTVRLEPAMGGNLFPDSSFETATAGQPTNWQLKADGKISAVLDWGHEMLSAAQNTNAATDQPATGQSAVAGGVSARKARTGNSSLCLAKNTLSANLDCSLAEPVAVVTGQEYLVSGWYNLEQLHFSSAMHFMVTLTAPGKEPRYFEYNAFLNPLVYTAPEEWRWCFLRFNVPADYANAKVNLTISLRGSPFTVWWDDLELRLAPPKIPQYPRGISAVRSQPRRGPDEVQLIMEKRRPVAVQVATNDGAVRLLLDGQPTPLFGLVPGPNRWPINGAHADFAEADVHVVWVPLIFGNTMKGDYGRQVWLDDGKYDFSYVEEILVKMLGYDLDAKIMFYSGVDPYPGFSAKHPETDLLNSRGEKERFPDGDIPAWSYTAEAYRREAQAMLRAFGQWVASRPVGKAVVGLHLTCGFDGQWFAMTTGIKGGNDLDRGPASIQAFHEWLKRLYNNDEAAFKKAWGQPQVTFATAEMIKEEERTTDNWFLNPAVDQDRRVIDANRFHSEGVAETINLFARAFKEGMRRPVIVTTYYHDILYNHGMNHWALKTLLDNQDLDGIVSVADYGLWRTLGRTGGFSSLVASLRLHGKLFLMELDYGTDNSWLPADAWDYRRKYGIPDNGVEGWVNQVRRDLGMCLAQGEGAWIYTLWGNSWIGDEGYMAGITEANQAATWAAENPLPQDRGQIAVFCDEQVEDYTTQKNIFYAALPMTGHNLARMALSRSGLSWDAYLLSDVADPRRPAYKVNIFLSAPTITPEQIAWVDKNLQKDGNVLVFVNGAGFCLGDGFEKNIARLTGMTVKADLAKTVLYRLQALSANTNPLAEEVANHVSEMTGPLFYVDDPDATPLALILNTDKVGLAVKRFPGWTSVYLGASGAFTPHLLRNLAGLAGVQPIGPEDDATFAGNGFLVIHALAPGEKTLAWREPSTLLDLSSGKIVATNATQYTFPMPALTTRWFRRIPQP